MDINPPTAVTTFSEPPKEIKQYKGVAARILNLIISGASQEQAAATVGVQPSYVSALCKEEDFQFQIVEKTRSNIETAMEIDQAYVDIEKILVEKLKTLAAWETTVSGVTRMLKYVNGAIRKTNTIIPNANGSGINGIGGQGSAAQPVTIILPQFIQQQFIMNPNKEIVAIGDRELVTLDGKQLNQMISKPRLSKPIETQVINHEPIKRPAPATKDPWGDL